MNGTPDFSEKQVAPDGDQETGQVRFLSVGLILPSPENAELYRPVLRDDPEIIALADSLREHGQQDDLIVTADYYIISGHRRHVAARVGGLRELRCRVLPFCKDDNHDQFMQLLRECNRQRHKTTAEKFREELLTANPEDT